MDLDSVARSGSSLSKKKQQKNGCEGRKVAWVVGGENCHCGLKSMVTLNVMENKKWCLNAFLPCYGVTLRKPREDDSLKSTCPHWNELKSHNPFQVLKKMQIKQVRCFYIIAHYNTLLSKNIIKGNVKRKQFFGIHFTGNCAGMCSSATGGSVIQTGWFYMHLYFWSAWILT